MYFADVIRGAKDLTGPFTGKASLKSNWGFNDLVGIEGHENRYRIYRNGDTSYEDLLGQSKNELQEQHETLKSNWGFNDLVGIEGHENRYRIYRNGDTSYEDLLGQSKNELQEQHETLAGWKNIYTIRHMTENKVVKFKDLKDALMGNGNGTATEPANVYQEDGAMAVLMDNTPTNPTEPEGQEPAPDIQDPCKDLIELRIV